MCYRQNIVRTLAALLVALSALACGQVETDVAPLTPSEAACDEPLQAITLAPGECLVATDDGGNAVSHYDGCKRKQGVALIVRAGGLPLDVLTEGGRVEIYAPNDKMCAQVPYGPTLYY